MQAVPGLHGPRSQSLKQATSDCPTVGWSASCAEFTLWRLGILEIGNDMITLSHHCVTANYFQSTRIWNESEARVGRRVQCAEKHLSTELQGLSLPTGRVLKTQVTMVQPPPPRPCRVILLEHCIRGSPHQPYWPHNTPNAPSGS